MYSRDSQKNMIDNSPEHRFFTVEWSQSREARITSAFSDVSEGLKLLQTLLISSYSLKSSFKSSPLLLTEEAIATACTSRILQIERNTVIGLYPHPTDDVTILIVTDDGFVYTLYEDGTHKKELLGPKNTVLAYWDYDDNVIYNSEYETDFPL